MAVIGTFTQTKDGGWEGRIRTLTINVRAKFVPNDNREGDRSPDYRLVAGHVELGAAWLRHTKENPTRHYLNVHLDDPSLPNAINAALFLAPDNEIAELVWTRWRS